jgi:hypothetical protein
MISKEKAMWKCGSCNWVLLTLLAAGCADPARQTTPAIDISKFLLPQEPAGATDVITARRSQDGDAVVLFGRIGGSENPWVEGVAAFTIVDSSIKPCNEIGDDTCPKPWDYC